MKITGLSLVVLLLWVTASNAQYTDILERLTQRVSAACADRITFCGGTVGSTCEDARGGESCLTPGCNSTEYNLVVDVACISSGQLDDLRELQAASYSLASSCQAHILSCFSSSPVPIFLKEYCQLTVDKKNCLVGGSSPCPTEQYDSFKDLACKGSSIHYNILLMIALCVVSKAYNKFY